MVRLRCNAARKVMVRAAVRDLGQEPAAAWRAALQRGHVDPSPGHVDEDQAHRSDAPFYWIHTIDQRNRTEWLGINVNRNWLSLSAYAGVTRVCVGRVMIDRTNSETLVVRPGISVNISISWTFG